MPNNPLHAQIQIARAQLQLEDDDYRAALKRAIGKTSSKGLTDPERQKVLAELRRLGFRPTSGHGSYKGSSKPYVRKIWAIWGQMKRDGIWTNPARESLVAFVKSQTGKESPDWLTWPEASRVIEALKAMQVRADA